MPKKHKYTRHNMSRLISNETDRFIVHSSWFLIVVPVIRFD